VFFANAAGADGGGAASVVIQEEGQQATRVSVESNHFESRPQQSQTAIYFILYIP
jgi:hypothetical protein